MADKLVNEKTSIVSMILFFFFLCFVPMTMAGQDKVTKAKELEVEKLLKKLNKPSVKSVKSPDGDIIDCVNILNQPAFDHPKLKNHKIQMRPTFYPERSNFSKSSPIAQLWHQSGNCPKGTIPIRRTTKDDILRADSIHQFGKKINQTIPDLSGSLYSTTGHEYAIAYLSGDRYYGAQASINIWKPHVQESEEFSLSQIWIVNRDGALPKKKNSDDSIIVETIEAGWQIYQRKYGDDNPRLFIYWTNNSYDDRNGCYNLECSGFVQVDNRVAVGGSLGPFSVNGGAQYEVSILIRKDPGSGNWWMRFGKSIFVGYWPASLFNHLSESATDVQWGGEIVNSRSHGNHTTTGMGSGYFPQAGFRKASFCKDVSIVNRNNHPVTPNKVRLYASNPNCYNISPFRRSNNWGAYFFYGGPGRNPNCL